MIWFAGVVSSRAGFHLSRYRELVPSSVGPGRQVVAALRPAKMGGAWSGFRAVTDPAHALKANVRSSTGTSVVMRTYRNTLRRSEEHTSELQSRGHLVCRLLLEK